MIRPGLSAGDGRREHIHVAFAAGATIAPLSMIFGYGAFVDTLPYGSTLLHVSLALLGSVEDQREMTPTSALVRHKDPLLPWCDSTELLQRHEDIIFSIISTKLVIPHSPLVLAHPILWRPPDKKNTW